MQELINQTIIKALASFNIQLDKLLLFVDFSNLVDFANQQNSLEQQDSSKLVELVNNDILEDNVTFRIFDLNYFYLDLEKFYSKSNIITTRKKTIYREVYIFCCRIDNYISIIEKKRLEITYLYAFEIMSCTNS